MIFVTWWTFQTCCSLLGMLGIIGEVGRPKSLRPSPSPKFLRPIPQLFREQIFLGRYWDFFLDQNFWDRSRDFFLRPKFSRPILRLFSRLNIFETNTETFFRDQNFWDREQYSQKIEKSLHTEKSWDEMSHSGWKPPEVVSFSVKNISRFSNKLKYNYKPIPVKTPILGLTSNSSQVTPN